MLITNKDYHAAITYFKNAITLNNDKVLNSKFIVIVEEQNLSLGFITML